MDEAPANIDSSSPAGAISILLVQPEVEDLGFR